jgi:hypothetical protein
MQAAGRASHRMRNTLICALPLAHQPAVVDAQIGGSARILPGLWHHTVSWRLETWPDARGSRRHHPYSP